MAVIKFLLINFPLRHYCFVLHSILSHFYDSKLFFRCKQHASVDQSGESFFLTLKNFGNTHRLFLFSFENCKRFHYFFCFKLLLLQIQVSHRIFNLRNKYSYNQKPWNDNLDYINTWQASVLTLSNNLIGCLLWKYQKKK